MPQQLLPIAALVAEARRREPGAPVNPAPRRAPCPRVRDFAERVAQELAGGPAAPQKISSVHAPDRPSSMKTVLSLLAIVALSAGSFGLGHRCGWRERDDHAYQDGYRWGMFERALFDQKMRAAEHGSPQPVPGFEAEAAAWQSAQAAPQTTSYLSAGH